MTRWKGGEHAAAAVLVAAATAGSMACNLISGVGSLPFGTGGSLVAASASGSGAAGASTGTAASTSGTGGASSTSSSVASSASSSAGSCSGSSGTGTGGGASVGVACNNSYAVGVAIRHDTAVSQLALLCATVHPGGTIDMQYTSTPAGGTCGTPQTVACPSDQVMVAFQYASNAGRVLQVTIGCQTVAQQDMATPPSSNLMGPFGGDPGGTPSPFWQCPSHGAITYIQTDLTPDGSYIADFQDPICYTGLP
jgi:hypothetical protein